MSMFYFFTKTLLNIIQNFIPHETVVFDDRDPPWMNKEIKKLIIKNNLEFKTYYCSKKNIFLLQKLKALQYQLNISIKDRGVAKIWNKYLKISWKFLTLMTSHCHPR